MLSLSKIFSGKTFIPLRKLLRAVKLRNDKYSYFTSKNDRYPQNHNMKQIELESECALLVHKELNAI